MTEMDNRRFTINLTVNGTGMDFSKKTQELGNKQVEELLDFADGIIQEVEELSDEIFDDYSEHLWYNRLIQILDKWKEADNE